MTEGLYKALQSMLSAHKDVMRRKDDLMIAKSVYEDTVAELRNAFVEAHEPNALGEWVVVVHAGEVYRIVFDVEDMTHHTIEPYEKVIDLDSKEVKYVQRRW